MTIEERENSGFVRYWNKGFTLIEALLGLTAFCMIASLLPSSIKVVDYIHETRLQAMEWEIFTSQIKKEVRTSQLLDTTIYTLFLTKEEGMVTYEKFGSLVRRRVNGTGHEVLLQNVNGLRFEEIPNGVKVSVEDIWGRNYTADVHQYFSLGSGE